MSTRHPPAGPVAGRTRTGNLHDLDRDGPHPRPDPGPADSRGNHRCGAAFAGPRPQTAPAPGATVRRGRDELPEERDRTSPPSTGSGLGMPEYPCLPVGRLPGIAGGRHSRPTRAARRVRDLPTVGQGRIKLSQMGLEPGVDGRAGRRPGTASLRRVLANSGPPVDNTGPDGNRRALAVARPTSPPATASWQPSFPVRAGFYYPWFPEAWNQGGHKPVHSVSAVPWLLYDGSANSVIQNHIAVMQYGHMSVGHRFVVGAEAPDGWPNSVAAERHRRPAIPLDHLLRARGPRQPERRGHSRRPDVSAGSVRLEPGVLPGRRQVRGLRLRGWQ